MPKRSGTAARPADALVSGTWPDGELAADAPVEARYAQQIARTLQAQVQRDSLRGVAHIAELSDTAIRAIIKGTTYPDVRTLARLESATRSQLLPDWDERQGRPPAGRPRANTNNLAQPKLPLGPAVSDVGSPTRALTAIEICAGAGGQAIGLERAGFEHVALVENDPWACTTLRSNRPGWKVLEQDVRLVDWGQFEQPLDLLAGGVPCPPFSVAGKQLGSDDERDLFPTMLAIARQLRPNAVMVENVRGLLSPKFDNYRRTLERELADLGYVSQGFRLLHASDFGVPQLRPRTLLVALKPEFAAGFAWPEPLPDAAPVTVGETLYPLMASNGWRRAAAWARGADSIGPTLVGGSKKHGGPDLGPTRAREQWARLGVEGVSLADAPPDRNFTGTPKLTVPMAALIQGFPADWHIEGRKTAAYRQVGNAFPPPVAAAVGTAIATALRSRV
jgi:DNA (cytosine-5)-methyltransferase 1